MSKELELGLKMPFNPENVSWRVGATTKDKSKCIPLAYIDARDVMDRLDVVVGAANWQVKYSHVVSSGATVCDLGIKIAGEWVWKANGAGETKVEAEKGATSDAFKRAAVLWGIGRYLYSLKFGWVALEGRNIDKNALVGLNSKLSSHYKKELAAYKTETKPAKGNNTPRFATPSGIVLDIQKCETVADITKIYKANEINSYHDLKEICGAKKRELEDI